MIEIAGTILLLVGVFRRLSPLLLNLLALAVGITMAFAGDVPACSAKSMSPRCCSGPA